ncbi:response regulator [Streptomyces sp. ISL-14]|nr:response regulator [Streptomyces sp. ISL-14]
MTNACRHARASQVTVAVRLAGGAARLEVTDDGRGFAPEETAAGFGLLGMRERVHLVPGNVDVESSPGAGTRVTVTVPRGTTAKFSVDGGGDMNDEEPDQAAPVRVLVVDDQRLIRDGIASLLSIRPGIEVVGTAVDGRDAVARTLEMEPDVVLMDVRMPGMDGVEAVAVLRERAPECRVVMLTTFDDEEYVVQALRAGAHGYLLKDLPAEELAHAVRLAHAGVTQLDSSVARGLTAFLPRPEPPRPEPAAGAPAVSLSPRETDILRLVAHRHTNREIAARAPSSSVLAWRVDDQAGRGG